MRLALILILALALPGCAQLLGIEGTDLEGGILPFDAGVELPPDAALPTIAPPDCPVLFTYAQEWQLATDVTPWLEFGRFVVITNQGNTALDMSEFSLVGLAGQPPAIGTTSATVFAMAFPELDFNLAPGEQAGDLQGDAMPAVLELLPSPVIDLWRDPLRIGLRDWNRVDEEVVSAEIHLASPELHVFMHLRFWPGDSNMALSAGYACGVQL